MNYYIIVASKDHVIAGIKGGFAQAGHGKRTQLDKLKKYDWIIYYSSKDKYEAGKAYQKFTAIGQVTDTESYQKKVNADFEPYRRNINFYAAKEVEIRPLLDDLNFIINRKNWGLYLMSGFVKIDEPDFKFIAKKILKHKNWIEAVALTKNDINNQC